jgi:hypothetical protein
MRTRARILIASLAAAAALSLPAGAAHANPLPCSGYGGQGAGGYVSSLVENCLNAIGQ